MLERGQRKIWDLTLLVVTVALIALSTAMIYSAKQGDPELPLLMRKHAVGLVLGLAGLVALTQLDYRTLARFDRLLYWSALGMLGLVLTGFGHAAKGAQRWIHLGAFQVQPSEIARLLLVLTLALYLSRRKDRIGEFGTLAGAALHLLPPLLLIVLQPDLGTAMVLSAIWFGMVFVAGAKKRHLAVFACAGLLLFAGAWHFGALREYQVKRLTVFLNPDEDRQGDGYHIVQSRIAIGSGELFGKGYRRGTQNTGNFVPENHTDFIFTTVGEEFGFAGAAGVVGLFFVLLRRGVRAIATAEDELGRLVAAGLVASLTFYTFVNIGMTLGIMPVTGVPLPFLSYGVSSLVVNLLAVGLLLRIGSRPQGLAF